MTKLRTVFICLTAILSFNLLGQLHVEEFERIKKEKHVREVIWKDSVTYSDFDIEKAMEYQYEDIVFLDLRTYHAQRIARSGGGSCVRRSLVRSAMLVNTQLGVDEMSTFDLGMQGFFDKYTNIGVRIFKPDGTVIELPEEDFEVNNEWKLAVPDLAIGDIIEVYFFYAEFKNWTSRSSSKTYTHYFTHEYPCLNQYLEFTVENGAHIKYRAMNGAPEPRIIKKIDGYGGSRMIFEKKETQTSVDDEWGFSRMLSEPALNYRFFFGASTESAFAKYHYDSSVPFSGKTTLAIDQATILKKHAVDFKGRKASKSYSKKLRKKVLKAIADEQYANDREKVIDIFERLAHMLRADWGVSGYTYMGTYDTVRLLGKILREQNIRSKWIYAPNKYKGDLSQVMHHTDFTLGLLVEADGGEPLMYHGDWLYYPSGRQFSTIDGVEAYYVSNDLSKDKIAKLITLPTSASKENLRKLELDMHFEEEELTGELIFTAGGNRNAGLAYDCSLNDTYKCSSLRNRLAIEENIAVVGYSGKSFLPHAEVKSVSRYEGLDKLEFEENEDKYLAHYSNFILDNAVLDLESFLNTEIEELDSMTVISTGRARTGDNYSFKTYSNIQDVTSKLGPNKLLELNWLMVSMDSDVRERESDVNLRYGYNDILTLRITLNEGTIVEGMDELSYDVTSEAGSFTSSAALNDNVLTIHCDLDFKNAHVPIEQWSEVIILMDALQDFLSGKLLIKPNG